MTEWLKCSTHWLSLLPWIQFSTSNSPQLITVTPASSPRSIVTFLKAMVTIQRSPLPFLTPTIVSIQQVIHSSFTESNNVLELPRLHYPNGLPDNDFLGRPCSCIFINVIILILTYYFEPYLDIQSTIGGFNLLCFDLHNLRSS